MAGFGFMCLYGMGLVAMMVMMMTINAPVMVLAGGPRELTDSTFQTEVFESGKKSFIKFYAPWCGHCKKLAPAWDRLGEEYADASSVLVGKVDCTVEKDTCSKFGVTGYPTLKYFTLETGEGGAPYQGSRDFDALKAFVEEKLDAGCDISNAEATCSDQERAYIDKIKSKGGDEVSTQLARLEAMSKSSMKPELKTWVMQRIAILKQM